MPDLLNTENATNPNGGGTVPGRDVTAGQPSSWTPDPTKFGPVLAAVALAVIDLLDAHEPADRSDVQNRCHWVNPDTVISTVDKLRGFGLVTGTHKIRYTVLGREWRQSPAGISTLTHLHLVWGSGTGSHPTNPLASQS